MAVYGLFCVYNGQPSDSKAKIRMTPAMWKDFKRLQDLAKQLKLFDVVFTTAKLRAMRAFTFHAMPTPLLLGDHEWVIGNPETGESTHRMPRPSTYSVDLAGASSLPKKLRGLHSDYLRSKLEVVETMQQADSITAGRLMSSTRDISCDVERFLEPYKAVLKSSSIEVSRLDLQRPKISDLHHLSQTEPAEVREDDDDEIDARVDDPQEEDDSATRAKRMKQLKNRVFQSSAGASSGTSRPKQPSECHTGLEVTVDAEPKAADPPETRYKRGALPRAIPAPRDRIGWVNGTKDN